MNEVRKRDKIRGLPNILSLFRSEFNKCNNTGARILDYNYLMTFKTNWKTQFWRENVKVVSSFKQRFNGRHYVTFEICKPLVVYRFCCMALYHS